jgi:hypothetical protein
MWACISLMQMSSYLSSSCLARLSCISFISSRYFFLLSVAGIFIYHCGGFSMSIHSRYLYGWNKWISRRGQRIYRIVWNLNRRNKLPPYHKVWIRIGTLEVTPPDPVTVIPLPHIYCTRTMTRALRSLMPRWKEATVPPICFTIYGRSFATPSATTWLSHTYQHSSTWPIVN